MVCYSRRPLPTGRGPYRTTRSAPTPGSPNIVCSGTTRACKNRSPPPLPFWEGRTHIGRGGETPPPLPFSTRYAARRSRTGVACLRMGGEEESARTGDSNPGCNYLMHFFWGGDMPHYSSPLPFRLGLAGCPCVLASLRGRPAR